MKMSVVSQMRPPPPPAEPSNFAEIDEENNNKRKRLYNQIRKGWVKLRRKQTDERPYYWKRDTTKVWWVKPIEDDSPSDTEPI